MLFVKVYINKKYYSPQKFLVYWISSPMTPSGREYKRSHTHSQGARIVGGLRKKEVKNLAYI
jgi:hypothetical protein